MSMERVIDDQTVSRRRKPVRILRMNSDRRFIKERFTSGPGAYNPAATGLLEQRIVRLKPAHARDGSVPGANEGLQPGNKHSAGQRISWLKRPLKLFKGHRILVILLCTSLAFLGLAVLPTYERPLDLSSFEMPPADDMAVLLLHAVIDGAAPDEEAAGVPPLPLTLSLRTYTIARNDTLDGIARRFNISLDTLISINGIADVRRLQVGAALKVPNIDGIVYKVQRGDNLSSIASRNNTTLLDLVDANDLASHTINPGQILFIPGARLSSYDLKKALGTLVIWPVSGRISSSFGYRNNPFTGIRQFHNGLDIVAPVNTPVKAAMDGRVAETGYSAIFGNFVIMTHAGSYQTLYAHLNRIDVRAGQIMSQGSSLGLLGSTGYSTGPHLHFGVFKSGTPTDPLRLLRGN
jgi:murein DD-endopeptidase MepM/ murein hydrolase activator NlpD